MDTPNISKAYRQQVLWPPVHSAVDVFVRRQAASAEPFELTWRLIHIWECAAISLAEAVIARWIDLDRRDDLIVVREKAYGRSWSESEARLETRAGALDGSIDKWIEIVDFIARTDPGDSPFLRAVLTFLGTDDSGTAPEAGPPIDLAPLLTAWARACDVTPGLTAGRVSVRHAMKAVNSFRNRFAHVPFPYDPVDAIYTELLRCTDELFGATPSPTSANGALSGAIVNGNSIIKGATVIPNPLPGTAGSAVSYVFGLSKATAEEMWPCSLFVHVDRMQRPYVLTRLKNEQGLWEYTRYLAESSAVTSLRSEDFLRAFPIPQEHEYTARDVEPVELGPVVVAGTSAASVRIERPVDDMSSAVTAVRERRFDEAITFLSRLTAERPTYHVGWLRLGHAQREWAVELMNQGDREVDAEKLLKDSLASLYEAGQHRDQSYQAEAHYHASKTHYRLWRLTGDEASFTYALEEAIEAKGIYPEAKYDSWIEYLNTVVRDPPTAAS